ncbi:MAG: DUF126 domain-containing protein [Gemmatimonadetes bacterium]|nr:DUF126 domain-containing protein [Gemmatimonadota bacterium]
MVGVTPEAATLGDAFGGRAPERTIEVGPDTLRQAFRELTSTTETTLGAVSIGTPHFSYDEFTRLRALLVGRRSSPAVEFFVSTGRDIAGAPRRRGWGRELRASGVQVVTDTCTYITPILSGPLSFWGGVHEATGDITDTHHPQHGASVSGRVLLLPGGRGSSSSSSVLAEVIRGGVGPAAILLGERDPIIALGAMVAEALYGRCVPVLVLRGDDYARARSWRRTHRTNGGRGRTA